MRMPMSDLIFYLLWIVFAGNLAQSFYLISLAKKFRRKCKRQDDLTQALENFRENLEDYYYTSEILSETMCEYYLQNKDHQEIKIRLAEFKQAKRLLNDSSKCLSLVK